MFIPPPLSLMYMYLPHPPRFLVMMLEKLMPPGYYTPGLLAAQADIVTTYANASCIVSAFWMTLFV